VEFAVATNKSFSRTNVEVVVEAPFVVYSGPPTVVLSSEAGVAPFSRFVTITRGAFTKGCTCSIAVVAAAGSADVFSLALDTATTQFALASEAFADEASESSVVVDGKAVGTASVTPRSLTLKLESGGAALPSLISDLLAAATIKCQRFTDDCAAVTLALDDRDHSPVIIECCIVARSLDSTAIEENSERATVAATEARTRLMLFAGFTVGAIRVEEVAEIAVIHLQLRRPVHDRSVTKVAASDSRSK
jgi:hypothetical protein